MTPKQKKAISTRMKAIWAEKKAARKKQMPSWGAMVDAIAAPDPVNHPTHYTSHGSGVECIQITEHMNFCLGNAMKYLWRADQKGGVEDLQKAAWYINREIERRK